MQTFLPRASFVRSARELDMKRLGKQRVETLQVLKALHGLSAGWGNHPITRMWRGYEMALTAYGVVICLEWQSRGYRDTCEDKILTMAEQAGLPELIEARRNHTIEGQLRALRPWVNDWLSPVRLREADALPWWFGQAAFHRSHRSNLLRKAPDLYPYDDVTDDQPYLWPDASKPGHYDVIEAK